MTKLFGKHEKQRKQHGIKKVAAAAALTAAVALAVTITGVLPGEGLQEAVTVEAAEAQASGTATVVEESKGPSTVTYDVYGYRQLTTKDQLNPKDNEWRDTLMIFEEDGVWYTPTSFVDDTETSEIRVRNVAAMLPQFDSTAEVFYSETKLYWRRLCSPDVSVNYAPLFLEMVKPNGDHTTIMTMGPSGFMGSTSKSFKLYSSMYDVMDAPLEVTNTYGTGKDTKFEFSIYYNKNGTRTKGCYLYYGCFQEIPQVYAVKDGNTTDKPIQFRVYDVTLAYTYTCINEDWSIGENQVYTADTDVILGAGCTLTVPKGAVLCVKGGPFYVNGTIDCYGTILVEDGGIILPYDLGSDKGGSGSYIKLRDGSSMIIEKGGRVYAGCPEGQLGGKKNGYLDIYQGSTLVNYGLLVVGKGDFNLNGSGGGTIENHAGGAMFLGYTVSDTKKFMEETYDASRTKTETLANALGLVMTGGGIGYADDGSAVTFIETWNGSALATANNTYNRSIKLYAHDKDYKYTEKTWKPN